MPAKYTYLREVQLKYRIKRVKADQKIGQKITDAETVFKLFLDMRDDAKEKLYLLCVDGNQKILCFELIAMGSDFELFTNQREIFRTPILISAEGVILVHNHPLGEASPSEEDQAFTQAIAPTARALGFKLIDHIIIAADKFYSFRENRELK